MFKKIPFAKPPIGNLRFQRPQPIDGWNGVWDATEYGPACMSNSSVTTSPQKWIDEDCLHLNIFTNDHCLKSKECSVVFYIHGGALNYDSAVMFNDSVLRETFVDNDIVLVIPAFRLGIFSHFVVEDQSIAPNNLALFDILLSMEFMNKEISNFGGDSQKVTLLGHSYGGSVVEMLTFSPKINQDLSFFQKSVIMSSGHDFDSLERLIHKTKQFAKQAKCLFEDEHLSQNEKDRKMMECLQKMDAFELLRIQRLLEDMGYEPINAAIFREPLFSEIPYPEFMNSPKNISIMTGCTRLEMDHSPADKPIAESVPYQNVLEVRKKYEKDRKEGNYDFENHADETQAIMVQTKIRVDKLVKKNIPVFLYEYTYPKHARHTDDLFYLMGVHRFEMDENERHLKEVYHQIFTDFIKFGNPGFNQSNGDTYFEVFWNQTTRPHMESHFEENILNYWLNDMVEYDKNITILKKSHNFPRKMDKSATMSLQDQSSQSSSFSFFNLFFFAFLISLSCLGGWFLRGRFGIFQKNHKNRSLYMKLEGDDGSQPYRGIY